MDFIILQTLKMMLAFLRNVEKEQRCCTENAVNGVKAQAKI